MSYSERSTLTVTGGRRLGVGETIRWQTVENRLDEIPGGGDLGALVAAVPFGGAAARALTKSDQREQIAAALAVPVDTLEPSSATFAVCARDARELRRQLEAMVRCYEEMERRLPAELRARAAAVERAL